MEICKHEGHLTVTLHKAAHLYDAETFGNQDSYAKFRVDKKKYLKTRKHVGGGIRPVWEQTFSLYLEGNESVFEVEIYNHQAIHGKDEFICGGKISLVNLIKNKKNEWIKLLREGEFGGNILISSSFVGTLLNEKNNNENCPDNNKLEISTKTDSGNVAVNQIAKDKKKNGVASETETLEDKSLYSTPEDIELDYYDVSEDNWGKKEDQKLDAPKPKEVADLILDEMFVKRRLLRFLDSIYRYCNLSPSGLTHLRRVLDTFMKDGKKSFTLKKLSGGMNGDTFQFGSFIIKRPTQAIPKEYADKKAEKKLWDCGVLTRAFPEENVYVLVNYTDLVSNYNQTERTIISWYSLARNNYYHFDLHEGNMMNGRLLDYDNLYVQVTKVGRLLMNKKFYGELRKKKIGVRELELGILCEIFKLGGIEITGSDIDFTFKKYEGKMKIIIDYKHYESTLTTMQKTQAQVHRPEYKLLNCGFEKLSEAINETN